MTWFAAASGKRGRRPKLSDATSQCCLPLKNLSALALRQTTGLVKSVLQLCGLAWSAPDFSTLCRRQRDFRKGAVFEPISVCKRLGHSVWQHWIDYLVETKMNCIKRLSEHVMSRTFERPVNELHIQATILNRFTELDRPQTTLLHKVG